MNLRRLGVLLVLMTCGMLGAEPAHPQNVAELQQRLDQTLQQGKYAWVRAQAHPPSQRERWGPLRAIRRVLDRIGDGATKVFEAFGRWLDRLASRNPNISQPEGTSKPAHVPLWLLAGLGAAALSAAILFFIRKPSTQQGSRPQAAQAVAITIDDEKTLATDLPEAEWLRLSEMYAKQGDGRLAVRALHLAELALLADCGLLTITQHKTLADYRAEVRRRGRSPAVNEVLARNGWRYESTWFGLHPASQELIDGFGHDLQGLREMTRA